MTTLELTKNYLSKRGAFKASIHKVVTETSKTITGDIPDHLRLSITLSELITLASHTRKSIKLHDGTIVPCNAYVLALASSGVSKDRSMNTVRKALKPAYAVLKTKRKEQAKKLAEQYAIDNGESEEAWLNYFSPPADLQVGLGTVEGLVNHFAMLSSLPLGSASIQNSEIGTELSQNTNLIDIMKTLAIGYDLGNIPVKVVKSVENRVEAIENFPINCLLFGSEEAILYDNAIRNKFKLIFNTQGARRFIFTYSPIKPTPKDYLTISSITDAFDLQRTNSNTATANIEDYLAEMIEYTTTEPLTLSIDAQKAMDVYTVYNEHCAYDSSGHYPITKLSRKHKQWLALKMSGTYSILDGENEISEENYILAINTIELLSGDLLDFEKELVKEKYEQFADYCKLLAANDSKVFISMHTLTKEGYISGQGAVKKAQELATMAAMYDTVGIYTVSDQGIEYSIPDIPDLVSFSFIPLEI